MKKTIDEKKEAFFYDRLKELFKDWQDREKASGRKWSQEEFARRINEVEMKRSESPRGKCDYRYVSKWLNGKAFPESYIEYIAEVLGVSVEELLPITHHQKYKYDSVYMNEMMNRDTLPYCEEIGLDKEFVKAIRKHVDFEKSFPLWTPIERNKYYLIDGEYYTQLSEKCLGDSAPMDEEVFQIRKVIDEGEEDRLITLSRPDLLFLRDVQREVSRYIEFLFIKRREDMEEEVKEANKRCERRLKDGGVTHVPLTVNEICDVAPYYKAFDSFVDEEGRPIKEV